MVDTKGFSHPAFRTVITMLWRILTQLIESAQSEGTPAQERRADVALRDYERLIDAQSTATASAVAAELAEDRRLRAEDERNRVEPDFLALVWASVAAAIAVGGKAAEHAGPLIEGRFDVVRAVWLLLAMVALIFIAANGAFAIRLTRQYALGKHDSRYAVYATSLSATIVLFFLGALILYLAGGLASGGGS
jgi:hypothetical protein